MIINKDKVRGVMNYDFGGINKHVYLLKYPNNYLIFRLLLAFRLIVLFESIIMCE